MSMKSVTNECLQSLQIWLKTPEGPKVYRLQPREGIVVPLSYLSEMVYKLKNRQLIKISNYS